MKEKYQDILTVIENKQKIQIRKNVSYFVVKVGKEDLNNYQKKADTEHCYDLKSLKSHLKQKCSLHSINFKQLENELNKALKPSTQAKILKFDKPMVEYSAISKFLASINNKELDR